jgi:hypothetical protein
MLNDADCSIDHLITADVLEHVRRDDLAFRAIYLNIVVSRKGAASAADPAGAIGFEREWLR